VSRTFVASPPLPSFHFHRLPPQHPNARRRLATSSPPRCRFPYPDHAYTTIVAFWPNGDWVAFTGAHPNAVAASASEHAVYPRLSPEDVAPPSLPVGPHTGMNPYVLCTRCAFRRDEPYVLYDVGNEMGRSPPQPWCPGWGSVSCRHPAPCSPQPSPSAALMRRPGIHVL
jgi:hypothetical protein